MSQFIVEIFDPWTQGWKDFRVFTDRTILVCWMARNIDRRVREKSI